MAVWLPLHFFAWCCFVWCSVALYLWFGHTWTTAVLLLHFLFLIWPQVALHIWTTAVVTGLNAHLWGCLLDTYVRVLYGLGPQDCRGDLESSRANGKFWSPICHWRPPDNILISKTDQERLPWVMAGDQHMIYVYTYYWPFGLCNETCLGLCC